MTNKPNLGVLKWNDTFKISKEEYEIRANALATKHDYPGVTYLDELPKPDYLQMFKQRFMGGKK